MMKGGGCTPRPLEAFAYLLRCVFIDKVLSFDIRKSWFNILLFR